MGYSEKMSLSAKVLSCFLIFVKFCLTTFDFGYYLFLMVCLLFSRNPNLGLFFLNSLFNVDMDLYTPSCIEGWLCTINENQLILCNLNDDYTVYQTTCDNYVEHFTFNENGDSTEVNILDYICGNDSEFLANPVWTGNYFDVTIVLLFSWVLQFLPQMKVSLWSYISLLFEICGKEDNPFDPNLENRENQILWFTTLVMFVISQTGTIACYLILWIFQDLSTIYAQAVFVVGFLCSLCCCCCLGFRQESCVSLFFLFLFSDYLDLFVLLINLCDMITLSIYCSFSISFLLKTILTLVQLIYCTKIHFFLMKYCFDR